METVGGRGVEDLWEKVVSNILFAGGLLEPCSAVFRGSGLSWGESNARLRVTDSECSEKEMIKNGSTYSHAMKIQKITYFRAKALRREGGMTIWAQPVPNSRFPVSLSCRTNRNSQWSSSSASQCRVGCSRGASVQSRGRSMMQRRRFGMYLSKARRRRTGTLLLESQG